MLKYFSSCIFIVILSSILTISYATPSFALDLFATYALALQKNELPAIQANISEQARETVEQAWAAVLPNVQASYSYLRQDAGAAGSISSLSPKDQTNAKITLTQPLFQGMKEYATLRSAKENVTINDLLTDQTRISLFQNVATAYFAVLASEQDIVDLEQSMQLHKERVRDLQERFQIGITRKGDLLLENSQIASLNAKIAAARYVVSQTRLQLAFLVGTNETINLEKANVKLPNTIQKLSDYLGAIDQRPDIQAKRSQIKVAGENIEIARGGHYPNINAFADYYLARTGAAKDSQWDFGLALSLPLYQGGGIESQIRQAALKRNQAQLDLDQTLRSIENTIRTLYDSVNSGILQNSSYQESVKAAEANYQEQIRDFKGGLITNLEVIQALSIFQDAKRIANKSIYQTMTAYAQLQSSIGKLPENL